MATFMRVSILRMRCRVWLTSIQYMRWGGHNRLCATTSGVTHQRRRSEHPGQNRWSRQWQSNWSDHRTNRVPSRWMPWCRTCTPAVRAGCRRWWVCLSCRHYRHRVWRIATSSVPPCQLVGADWFVLTIQQNDFVGCKLRVTLSTHLDNFVFCALMPLDVVGRVGIVLRKDVNPPGSVTWIE